LRIVRDQVFTHFRKLNGGTFALLAPTVRVVAVRARARASVDH